MADKNELSWGGERILDIADAGYRNWAFPVISRLYGEDKAQLAHERAMQILGLMDNSRIAQVVLGRVEELTSFERKVEIGGVKLSQPVMLAAGWVKGVGFENESDALRAVERGENIIPGYRSMTKLAGPVEFGSYTRYPRAGNEGTVMWRHTNDRSAQNRVGLKNPGAVAAAMFMKLNWDQMPQEFGINIATSPGVDDLEQQKSEVLQSAAAFVEQDVLPSWMTLNLSCPNTEDDPSGNQTQEMVEELCGPLVRYLDEAGVPLWVKMGPDLTSGQCEVLMKSLNGVGVKAVIATNTLAAPAPGSPEKMAGLSGRVLHDKAVEVAGYLVRAKRRNGYDIDVIGCGGVENGEMFRDFGIEAVQILTALVYRGPFAGRLIAREAQRSVVTD